MGMNLTYYAIYTGKEIETSSIVDALNKFINTAGLEIVDNKFLSYENWKLDEHLFSIGITPINCFYVDSWDAEKDDWTLLSFSDIPKKMFDWAEFLSEHLATFIEIHNVYDIVNEYSIETIGTKKQSNLSANGFEWFIPHNYYELKTHPNPRKNSDNEIFITCRNDTKTSYDT